ncbi:hypothetical protein N7463_010932 [Penicillium fimorum]|uniref:Uncharacterized protein n=1 Tax=Penicillium fimorum TaxID=1882269 RepID=A0A9X0C269_9EURO|nr:hypothetical protein N7463_010932 [Penicillium fimorum]
MSNMFGFSRAVIAALVVLCCSNALRRNCPVVTGHVGIGPFSGNDTVHINLDGVEVIEGTLGEYPYTPRDYLLTQPSYTLSRIHAYDLVDLDLTSLHSADSITLGSPNLHTLHHTKLRNATSLSIHSMQINSLDSLSDNELNLEKLYINGPFPNVNSIAIGCTSVDYMQVLDNSSVTLGGSSTKEMTIKQLDLNSITGLKRSATLQTLEVDSMKLSGPIHITHLKIPFDNLRELQVLQQENSPLKTITLPPKAVDWTGGFGLVVTGGPDLNLTSRYGADDQGKRIQTWYWPKNVLLIDISGATVGNTFFDSFVTQQMGLNKDFPPSVLSDFRIVPSANSTTFNCTTFRELEGMGRLPSDGYEFSCYDPYLASGAIRVHVPITLSFVSAVLGICIWMI